jgi:hypothetical protein
VISTQRIRCNYCNRRIPASSVVCPNCQRNPRAFYWKRWHVFLVLGIAALALVAGAIFFAEDLRTVLPTGIALNPTPARTNTRAPITVVLVATRAPSTATRLPPSPTRENTPTVRPTDVPTLSSWTATPGAVNTSAQTPNATETPSPIPSPIPVAAPQLISPTDGERIIGANKRVELQFHPAQTLTSQEWFRIQVDFLDRAGNPVSWCGFTKESSQEFPRDFFDDSSPSIRSFFWRVNVVRSNQFSPTTCDAPYDILSPPSDPWTFYWY